MCTLLVCGGREYTDSERLYRVLDTINRDRHVTLLINGGQRGADRLASKWAGTRGVPLKIWRADWQEYGHAAGAIRNQLMLEQGKPTLAVAFPGNEGTADMLARLKRAGVECVVVGAPQDLVPCLL